MSQVGQIHRTTSDYSTTVHENYIAGVKPQIEFADPVAGIFQSIGSKDIDLRGEKFQFAIDVDFAGGWMGTDGYLPDHEQIDPVEANGTVTRLYLRRAIDNLMKAQVQRPGAYEDAQGRITRQQWDAVKRGTARHVHGGSAATVCTFVSRTSATVLVVDSQFGYGTAWRPTAFLRKGMTLALLDANDSYNTIGVATISSVAHNTSATTATITFATDIDTSSTGADGDPLVFATTNDSTATHYVNERNRAPNGLLDIVDPAASTASLFGVAESSVPEWAPYRQASSDFGHIELMEFAQAKRAASLSGQEHNAGDIYTASPGAVIELAKDLLGFQRQEGLGGRLNGGWTHVSVGGMDFVESDYHVPDVIYCLCPEDLFVATLEGEASVWSGDGSQYSRIPDYDGMEWFVSQYLQRGALRRNRLGALTGITVANQEDYQPIPGSV